MLSEIGDSITPEQTTEMLAIHDVLETAGEQSPPKLAHAIDRLDRPFAQFVEVMESGGGQANLDTATVPEDMTLVMEQCVAAGFKVKHAT